MALFVKNATPFPMQISLLPRSIGLGPKSKQHSYQSANSPTQDVTLAHVQNACVGCSAGHSILA